MSESFVERSEKGLALSSINSPESVQILQSVIFDSENNDEESLKIKEQCLIQLANYFKKKHQAQEIVNLIRSSRPYLLQISKAKTAKIVKTLVDLLNDIEGAKNLQIEISLDTIAWSKEQKRMFLKQSLETKLIALYLENKQYSEALGLIGSLLRELKKLDDKMLLVEVQLLESRACLELRNVNKSRAALTSARTSANAIYCPPIIQASLDIQSGILHAEEKDFKTAYSYFFEAMEGFSTQDDPRAISALKYMLLSKIMLHTPDDVASIANGKTALKYVGREVDAMRAMAKAAKNRSLKEFESVVQTYPKELEDDPIVKSHLSELYDSLLESNLIRIIEPFSVVEISHVAKLIQLPIERVEQKISQMILDKKFQGVLDQGVGRLVVFDEPQQDKIYDSAIHTIQNMGKVVDSLYRKTTKLS